MCFWISDVLSSNGGDTKDRPSAYTSSIFSANSHHLPLIPLCLSLTLPFSYSIYTSFLSLAFECSSTFFRRWTSGRHYCCRNPEMGYLRKTVNIFHSHFHILSSSIDNGSTRRYHWIYRWMENRETVTIQQQPSLATEEQNRIEDGTLQNMFCTPTLIDLASVLNRWTDGIVALQKHCL